ncbi:AraC family transcriptional regulator [Catenuloplanes japonicus]|uniref:AraC family transcriptional regulator n=1 Tax=Catenuloplanes japonicus TaxID=33876 RepID=UPI001E5A509E|nr:AraC family transcriptional regulator [Catenuloplanes japonicus]
MITAAISSVRVGTAYGRRVAGAGPTGIRFPAIPLLGFHVMRTGHCWLITERETPVHLRPGDIVFIAAGAEHGIARHPCTLRELTPADPPAPPPSTPVDFEFLCGAYQFPQGRVPAFLRRIPPVVAFTPDYDRHPELRMMINVLAADLDKPAVGSDAIRAALIDLVVVHILHRLGLREDPRIDAGVSEVLAAIHAHPERAWTVQQLSEMAGMSRASFTRRFRDAVGMSPMAYLIDWRMTSAAGLLQESAAPLTAIARRAGYSTPFAFTAAFRRKYGVAPGRFRELHTRQT